MNTSPIASELSFEVLQRRRREFQLSTPPLDSSNQRLITIPGHLDRHAYFAERNVGVDRLTREARRLAKRLER